MLRRPILALALLISSGCATTALPKMSFDEAGLLDPGEPEEPPAPPLPPPAAHREPAAAPSRPTVLSWPIPDAGVSSFFGLRVHPMDGRPRMHFGVDLAAAAGRVVSSAAPGVVVHAGPAPGYGLMVEVRHGSEITSRYSHLSRLLCRPGDRLEDGQPLGLVGATGRATGPHLHFEVWRFGRAEDPLALLGIRPVEGSASN